MLFVALIFDKGYCVPCLLKKYQEDKGHKKRSIPSYAKEKRKASQVSLLLFSKRRATTKKISTKKASREVCEARDTGFA